VNCESAISQFKWRVTSIRSSRQLGAHMSTWTVIQSERVIRRVCLAESQAHTLVQTVTHTNVPQDLKELWEGLKYGVIAPKHLIGMGGKPRKYQTLDRPAGGLAAAGLVAALAVTTKCASVLSVAWT
jgi:hypothetical protein